MDFRCVHEWPRQVDWLAFDGDTPVAAPRRAALRHPVWLSGVEAFPSRPRGCQTASWHCETLDTAGIPDACFCLWAARSHVRGSFLRAGWNRSASKRQRWSLLSSVERLAVCFAALTVLHLFACCRRLCEGRGALSSGKQRDSQIGLQTENHNSLTLFKWAEWIWLRSACLIYHPNPGS